MTDEPGSCSIATRNQPRTAARAKPGTVKEKRGEMEVLSQLEMERRQMDVETILRRKGADHAVTELYSPPRIVDMAHAMGFKGWYSLDLTNPSPDGRPWEFSKIGGRVRCWRLIKHDRPYLSIGSPPHAPTSQR